MFKIANLEDEIYKSMEKQLIENQSEEKNSLAKLAKAKEYIKCAAEIFEQAGMSEESVELKDLINDQEKSF